MPMLVLLTTLLLSVSSQAQVLFEGYYRILQQNQPIGYSVQKYESDQKAQQFKSTVFIKTNAQGGNVTESITTVSDLGLNPIRFNYTGIIGKTNRTIDAEVQNGQLLVTIKENGKTSKNVEKLEPGLFLSGVLIYSILRSPEGLKPSASYTYKAIAEEDASITQGKAIVGEAQMYRGKIRSYRVENEFKGTKFVSFVTETGEVLSTTAPLQGITTELVPLADMATRGQVVPQKALQTLFGSHPKGESNTAFRAHQKNEWPLEEPEEIPLNKQQGVPPGKGIHTKGK